MTDTVRIMPRQPIEAERINRPPVFRSLGREVPHHDGHETFLSARYWHEVSDPIVWDGTDDAFAAIREALLPSPWRCHKAVLMPHDLRLRLVNDTAGLGVWIQPGWRIRIVDDSFVILPPEVTE